MTRPCRQCSASFETSPDDLSFLEKVSPTFGGKKELIPPPTLCPDCRQQRRLSFRNERKFYHRKCDATGKQIISVFSPDKPYTVFQRDAWWGDAWDPLSYGSSVNFDQPFFAQFAALFLKVPRVALMGKNLENCDYTSHCDHAKNCYLCVDVGGGSENIYYSQYVIGARDCVDCYMTSKSELCYECLYTEGYRCAESFLAEGASNCFFTYNCSGCTDCFLCWNLRNKKFCIENKQYSETEYRRILQGADLGKHSRWEFFRKRFNELLRSVPRRHALIVNSEDCVGGSMHNCKNVRNSFEMGNSRDCRYCYDCEGLVDCADAFECGFDCELQYETHACNRTKTSQWCSLCYDDSNLLYCDSCHNSRDCFGCVGLRNKQYCILNKQYTKEEYERLVPRIIAHMRSTGEWGEFFPSSISPFGYNETVADEYYPLDKKAVLARGWKWHEEEDSSQNYLGAPYTIPDDIADVSDDITKQILRCSVTNKPYKIIPQELQFYRQMHLPIPRKCPDQRHKERLALRNPRKLWQRACAKCKKSIETTYAPDRPEIVYCESCYLASVY